MYVVETYWESKSTLQPNLKNGRVIELFLDMSNQAARITSALRLFFAYETLQ